MTETKPHDHMLPLQHPARMALGVIVIRLSVLLAVILANLLILALVSLFVGLPGQAILVASIVLAVVSLVATLLLATWLATEGRPWMQFLLQGEPLLGLYWLYATIRWFLSSDTPYEAFKNAFKIIQLEKELGIYHESTVRTLITQVEALRGRILTNEQADELVTRARAISDGLSAS